MPGVPASEEPVNVLEWVWFAITSAIWWMVAHWIAVLIIVAVTVIVGEAFDKASRVIEAAKRDVDH